MMGLWALAFLPLILASAPGPGPKAEYHDILHKDVKEWRLAFRGSARIGTPVYDAYKDSSVIPSPVPDACKGTDWDLFCDSHYRNDDALDNWKDVKDVLFGIVKDGALVRTIMFNASMSNNMDWFKKERIEKTCYEDLSTQPQNYFSIEGDTDADRVLRHFFINRNYGGCPSDRGWFVAVDGPATENTRPCSWEERGPIPVLLFSPSLTNINWNSEEVLEADAMVIFLRYKEHRGDDIEYFDLMKSGKKEYRLAFRGSAYVGSSMYAAYKDGTGAAVNPPAACLGINFKLTCGVHYRNSDALNTWYDIEEVVFGIIRDGAMVKHLRFHGQTTDYMSWFSHEYLIKDKKKNNCWSDLVDETTINYFSIKGHEDTTRVQRRFFINRKYQNCPGDQGWTVVIDGNSRPCPWEIGGTFPKILYSADTVAQLWTTNNAVHEADSIVIFLKYKEL